jgi:hypothetical protein
VDEVVQLTKSPVVGAVAKKSTVLLVVATLPRIVWAADDPLASCRVPALVLSTPRVGAYVSAGVAPARISPAAPGRSVFAMARALTTWLAFSAKKKVAAPLPDKSTPVPPWLMLSWPLKSESTTAETVTAETLEEAAPTWNNPPADGSAGKL